MLSQQSIFKRESIVFLRALKVLLTLATLMLSSACVGEQEPHSALPDIEFEIIALNSEIPESNNVSTSPESDTGVNADTAQKLEDTAVNFSEITEETVINFWATWCAPCRAELADFDHVARSVIGTDIIGVNVGEDAETARALLSELDISYPNVADPQAQLTEILEISGLPVTVFVRPNNAADLGRSDIRSSLEIVHIHHGVLNAQELRDLIATHLHPDN